MRRPTAAQTRRWAAATTAALAVAAIAVAALAPAHHSRPAPPAPAAGHSMHSVGTAPHAGSEAADPHALPPLLPLTPRTVATLVAAAAVAALAAGGGIGGGGVLVPLYLLLLRAGPRDAVALSNLTILGGALASFVRNAPRRHPTRDRPLVDWDIMLMMEPATVVGAVAGSYINRAAPPWATTSALAALLVAITAQLTGRARRLLAAERAEDEALLGADGDGEAPPPLPPAAAALADPHADPRLVPLPKLAALVALFGVVVASDEAKARVPRGSAAYWAAASAVAPAALAVSWVARRRLLKAAAAAPAPATPAAADDDDAPLHWTPTTTILFPAASTLAGVVAGAFGVGGGIVKGPLMLELGVSPPVAAATASAMILFTSASASVVYVSFGVPLDYGAALAAVGAAATAAGLTLVARVAAGRRSAVVVAMAGLLAASAVATGYYAALLVWGGGGVN